MTPIQTNKTVFFDKAGDPLAGSIYIGQPSQDPRTSPKTVTLRDSGGVEFTASQPLTVSQGRVVYNGKPIVALVDGDHSMLTFDAAGTQVDYSQLVEPASGSGSPADFSEVIRVGLTLSEIKAFNVSVGDTVRNVGEVTATDGLGKDWLAVSATGSPGDDITLINFANGLQGKLYQAYPGYQEATVTLGGAFGAQTVEVVRVGNVVTITSASILTHTINTVVYSGSGVIPAWARPAVETPNNYGNNGDTLLQIAATPVGEIYLRYHSMINNSSAPTTNSSYPPSLSYAV